MQASASLSPPPPLAAEPGSALESPALAPASAADILHRTQNASQRVPILDGIRAVAALLVFLGHATVLEGTGFADTLWRRLFSLNGLGAVMFFVLSGFLVTEVLLKADRRPRYFFFNFYMRRAIRLLPLYWALLLAVFVVVPYMPVLFPALQGVSSRLVRIGEASSNQWMYWCGLSNFAVHSAGGWRLAIVDVSWSLAIELQYYLVWPVFVYFLSRRQLAWLSFVMILASLSYRLAANYLWDHSPVQVYVSTYARVGAFATGSLVCIVLRDRDLLMKVRPYATFAALMVVPSIWGLMAFEDVYGKSYITTHGVSGGPLSYSVLNTIVGVGVGGLICRCLVATEQGRLNRLLCSRPLSLFAKYSYAFFLLHLPVRAAVRDVLFGPASMSGHAKPLVTWPTFFGSEIPAQIAFYFLSFGASFAMAFVTWHLFEKRWLELSRFFPSRPKPAPAAADARADGRSAPPG